MLHNELLPGVDEKIHLLVAFKFELLSAQVAILIVFGLAFKQVSS